MKVSIRGRRIAGPALCAAVLVAMAAVSLGIAYAASPLTQVANQIAALQKRPTKITITKPIKGPIPRGKTIVWLSCGVPSCDQKFTPLKQAAATVGW
jgi:hypothetical protein